MKAIVINENTDEGRVIMSMLKAAQESSDAVISIRDVEAEEIPRLAYAKEERIASVRRGVEDIRAGRVHTPEEVRAMFPRS